MDRDEEQTSHLHTPPALDIRVDEPPNDVDSSSGNNNNNNSNSNNSNNYSEPKKCPNDLLMLKDWFISQELLIGIK